MAVFVTFPFNERSVVLPLQVMFTKNDTVRDGSVASTITAGRCRIVCAPAMSTTINFVDDYKFPRLKSLNLEYETTTLAFRTNASV